MTTYFIGDLQGCYAEFCKLLEQVQFNEHTDKLYLVGDLVARGENSLACLRLVKSLGSSAQTVLGNHDLHLLATYAGIRKPKMKDKIEAILQAPDCEELIHWLRHQPLCVYLPEQKLIMAHAGISPQWDLATALQANQAVQSYLQSPNYVELLTQMYDETPNVWREDLTGFERLRYIINAFTRMRYCFADGSLDFECKLPVEEATAELIPWFKLHNPLYQELNIVFGHWASLMSKHTPVNIYALDTGCVWGNYLSLLRWEDKQIFTQTVLQ